MSEAERKRIGKAKFRQRVHAMIGRIAPIWNYDHLYIGGGNAKKLDPATLPKNVHLFKNVDGLRGGIRLWEDALASD